MISAWRVTLWAVLLAGSLCALPIPGSADPNLGVPVTPTGASGPPVEIDECKLLYTGNWLAGESAGIKMKFTNDSTAVADVVNVHVTANNGESLNIRDVGRFSPGIEITHTYKEGNGHMMFAPMFTHPRLDCAITSVHFADGSVWQTSTASAAATAAATPRPAATPQVTAVASTLSSAPSSLSFDGTGESYDRFVSVTGPSALGAVRKSGNCAGIVRVTTVAAGARSVALRVSPIARGSCTIVLFDGARRTVAIPVAVAPKLSPPPDSAGQR